MMMTTIKKIFNFWLIFSFLSIGITFADDDNEDCSDGQEWSESLNRCVLATSTVSSMTDASECQNLTGDDYTQCFYDNANGQLAEGEADGDISSASDPESKYAISAVVTLGAAYILYKKKDLLNSCGQTSMWLMLAGASSSLIGELYAQYSYKKKLKGLQAEYTERMSLNPTEDDDTDATSENIITSINENQQIAYDFQIKQEKAREKAHKARALAYNLSFGLYAASAVASIYDAYINGGKGCGNAAAYFTPMNQRKSELSQEYASLKNSLLLNKELFGDYHFLQEISKTELFEIVERKLWSELSPIKSSYALVATTTTANSSLIESLKGLMNGNLGIGELVDKAIKTPVFRASVAGVLSAYSKTIANKASDLAEKAGKRVGYLTEIRDSFVANGGSSYSGCSDEDRDDSSKPSCYCFDSDGTKNSSRSSTTICKKIYASSNLSESEYGVLSDSSSANEDAGCVCDDEYKTTCSSSTNSCFTLSGSVSLGNLSGISGLTSAMKEANDLSSGKISASNLSDATASNLAASAKKAGETLAQSIPTIKEQLAEADKIAESVKSNLANVIRKGLKNGTIRNPLSSGSLGSSNSVPKKEEKAEEKIEEKKSEYATGGENLAGTSSSGTKAIDFNFGGNRSKKGGVVVEGAREKLMKKNFNYNDINESSQTDLFQLISNRYQVSGLRLLFESGKRAPSTTSTKKNKK